MLFALLLFVGLFVYLVAMPIVVGVLTEPLSPVRAAERFLRNVAPYVIAFASAGWLVARSWQRVALSSYRMVLVPGIIAE